MVDLVFLKAPDPLFIEVTDPDHNFFVGSYADLIFRIRFWLSGGFGSFTHVFVRSDPIRVFFEWRIRLFLRLRIRSF